MLDYEILHHFTYWIYVSIVLVSTMVLEFTMDPGGMAVCYSLGLQCSPKMSFVQRWDFKM